MGLVKHLDLDVLFLIGGFMEKTSHNFKKKYGQNFINDYTVIQKIVSTVSVEKNDLVIEIGPGAGILTKELLKKTRVLAYEIDTELKSILESELKNENLTIIWDDFLRRNVTNDIKGIDYNNLFLIANLPYYITTPIIQKLIDEELPLKSIVVMVQKEVADRFCAQPGNKEYGSITAFLNYYFHVNKVLDVKKDKFFPQPKVDSAVISLKTRTDKFLVKDEKKLFQLIKDSFKFKRKNLRNNLKGYDLMKIEQILNKYDMDLNIRAESISIDLFCEISNFLD